MDDGVELEFNDSVSTGPHIRKFEDIPDIITMEIPRVDYIVPALGIARNTVTLWAGLDGTGKSMLAQAMAVAVARGQQFLGMPCRQAPVLYLDLENPNFAVQDRLRAMAGEEAIPNLKIWGDWNIDDPPHFGSELLLTIAKETRPLIVVDPLGYFHSGEENSASEMTPVMRYFRACAAYGSAVVLLHHVAKTEGSTGRGSSAIHYHSDLAFLHTLDQESSLVTLKVDKNKHGARHSITIRADFEQSVFELTDAPWISSRNEKLSKLERIIRENPGISTQQLCSQAGGMKTRVLKLLDEGRGTLWTVKKGLRGAKLFYPCSATCSLFSSKEERTGEQVSGPSCSRTPKNTLEQENTSEGEQLCSVHGWHSEWAKPNGVRICLKCHPAGTPAKEVDSGKKMPVLLT